MVKKEYVPDRGDIVWLQFDPQKGREQRGKRPAMVLSPKSYNRKVGLGLFCSITSKVKGYPFEVVVEGTEIEGVVLADQVKSFDWRRRQIDFIEKAKPTTLADVTGMVRAIIE